VAPRRCAPRRSVRRCRLLRARRRRHRGRPDRRRDRHHLGEESGRGVRGHVQVRRSSRFPLRRAGRDVPARRDRRGARRTDRPPARHDGELVEIQRPAIDVTSSRSTSTAPTARRSRRRDDYSTRWAAARLSPSSTSSSRRHARAHTPVRRRPEGGPTLAFRVLVKKVRRSIFLRRPTSGHRRARSSPPSMSCATTAHAPRNHEGRPGEDALRETHWASWSSSSTTRSSLTCSSTTRSASGSTISVTGCRRRASHRPVPGSDGARCGRAGRRVAHRVSGAVKIDLALRAIAEASASRCPTRSSTRSSKDGRADELEAATCATSLTTTEEPARYARNSAKPRPHLVARPCRTGRRRGPRGAQERAGNRDGRRRVVAAPSATPQ